MKKKENAAWSMVGAVIGAGFASGREIASFFSRWGLWSYAGIAAAVAVIGWSSLAVMRRPGLPQAWKGRWTEKLWRILFSLLLTAVGGAMLSASGEIAALLFPFRGTYWMGLLISLGAAMLLVSQGAAGLAWASRLLTVCLAAMLLAGLALPRMRGVALEAPGAWRSIPQGLWQGICYGGFNAALAAPVLGGLAEELNPGQRRRSVMLGCGMLLILLAAGNTVLLRHTALQGEALPMIRMLMQLGKTGYLLGAAALWLAMLTTLIACLAGFQGRLFLPCAAMLACAMMGFAGTVEMVYPALGGACFVMLAAAHWQK